MSHSSASSPLLVEELPALLRTRRFGRHAQGYQTVTSTNTVAMQWAQDGAPEGSVVFAEYQTLGRGRQGRTWEADAGQNLMFSVVLRPSLPAPRLNLITLAASIAVAESVAAFTAPLAIRIRWPNDILLEGMKCCGMLLESTLAGPDKTIVILGIGLNVNQSDFPKALTGKATSLLLQTGRRIPRAALLADVLERLERYYDLLDTDQETTLRHTYETHLYRLGQSTTLCLTGQKHTVEGVILGISDTGALRLETSEGIQTFLAGEVTSNIGRAST